MKFSLLAASAAICHSALATPLDPQNYVLHERRDSASTWSKSGSVPSNMILPMRIGLSQTNLDKGHDWLLEVSDPNSSKYGQYYQPEEIHDLFAPTEQTLSAVTLWLDAAGIKNVSQSVNKQWLQFDASVTDAERLLRTKYHYFEDDATDTHALGCDEYSLPDNIRPHVDYITPAVKMITFRKKSNTPSNQSKRMTRKQHGSHSAVHSPLPMDVEDVSKAEMTNNLQMCSAAITPNCIAALYNISKPTEPAHPGNQLGIYETSIEFLDAADLNSFFARVAPQIPNGTFPVFEGIDGAPNLNHIVDKLNEAVLDFEVAYPIIWPQNPVLFQTNDYYYDQHGGFLGNFNTFLDAIDGSYCNYTAFGETGDSPADPTYPDPNPGGYKGKLQCGVYKPTNVISISYIIAETGYLPNGYIRRQCNEYLKLGMQGITVVTASGDNGVGICSSDTSAFTPFFPASCPYVTAVGATAIPPNASVFAHVETAARTFSSGGDFSNLFARTPYQKSAVADYLRSPAAPTFPYYTGSNVGNGLYNRSGRAYPDVSAIGDAIFTVSGGVPEIVAGTSASTPLIASIFTRINEVRLAAGKPTIGFVNPTLYQNPHVFHDVTKGDNPGTFCTNQSFSAGHGWDPVTGLGTPNYPALLQVFMGSPPPYA